MDPEMMARLEELLGSGVPQTDPRASALFQMMSKQGGIPSNYRAGVPPQGQMPVEAMMTHDESFGGDSSLANAFGGGYDQYAGGNYPPSPMQMRNRRVMHPEMSEDDHESQEMQENYHRNVDETMEGEYPEPESRNAPRDMTTEDELGMVQQQIDKPVRKEGQDGLQDDGEAALSGDEDADLELVRSLMVDKGPGGDTSDWANVVRAFEQRYGYDPTDQLEQEYDDED